jgi:DNA-directed RNA polymerase specialized sigma24 family protein
MAKSGPKGLDFTKRGRPGEGVIEAGALPHLDAFQRHRAVLFSIAYRILGSVADAEDMLQETFIRWQQSSDVEVQSPQAFLVTVISRLCINHLQSARVRREQYVGQWLPEPLLTGTAPVSVSAERCAFGVKPAIRLIALQETQYC